MAGHRSKICDILMPNNAATQTPRFLEIPPFARPNSAACALGLNCNFETTLKTLFLVLVDTLLAPFTTRDTIADETPASLATSLTVLGRVSCVVRESAGTLQDLER